VCVCVCVCARACVCLQHECVPRGCSRVCSIECFAPQHGWCAEPHPAVVPASPSLCFCLSRLVLEPQPFGAPASTSWCSCLARPLRPLPACAAGAGAAHVAALPRGISWSDALPRCVLRCPALPTALPCPARCAALPYPMHSPALPVVLRYPMWRPAYCTAMPCPLCCATHCTPLPTVLPTALPCPLCHVAHSTAMPCLLCCHALLRGTPPQAPPAPHAAALRVSETPSPTRFHTPCL